MESIFRFPRGLLDLLNTKAVGRNPSVLLASVTPGIDLTPFYLAGVGITRQSGITGTLTTLNGGVLVATIPVTEIWVPIAFQVQTVSIGAGDAGKVMPQVTDEAGQVLISGITIQPASASGSGSPTNSIDFFKGPPIVLPPNTRFSLNLEQIVVGTTGVTGGWSVSYYRIAST